MFVNRLSHEVLKQQEYLQLEKKQNLMKSKNIPSFLIFCVEKPDKFDPNFFRQNTRKYEPKPEEIQSLDPNSLAYQINCKFAAKRGSKSLKRLSKLVKFESGQNAKNNESLDTHRVHNESSTIEPKQLPKTISVIEKPKSRLIEMKIKQEAEAYQKRKEQYSKMHEEQNKAMSAFKIRKILMRKVSLKFGIKGQQEFLAKMIDNAMKDKGLDQVKETQGESNNIEKKQDKDNNSRSRSNRRCVHQS